MTFLQILDTLLLGPLRLLFEVLYSLAMAATENVGFSIVLLSLVINLLILPLYMCADAMQERTRLREQELAPSIKHIKKTFKGDERMMVLQTFYKQNHYSPLSALSGAVSLLLEIPFFIAAYSFLSGVAEFQGTSLGPILDLSKPDGLLTIGSLTINVLPFIMTLFNIVASILFLKGAPLKAKIQLYAMAAFFLVFLYTSPAGLLFYWTLNNLFSLIKNVFYKFKQPKTVICYMLSAIGILIPILFFALNLSTLSVRLLSFIATAILQIPLAIHLIRKKGKLLPKDKVYSPNRKIFILGVAFVSILLGLLIPSAVLASSPTEFQISPDIHPVWYVVSSACLSAGMFCVWFGVFYWLASPKGKVMFEKVIWIIAIVMFVNYMFFGQNLGNMSANLQYDNSVNYTNLETTLNLVVIVAIVALTFFIATKFKNIVIGVLTIAIATVSTMSTVNLVNANSTINEDGSTQSTSSLPSFNLSANGQNVVFLMLDRALGEYVPYILNEKPELKDVYEGFTYYSNVISFGGHTNYASPALLGGYEYTPVELNKKSDLSLGEKQNQANLIIPRILTENNWENGKSAKATIFEPMYTNYTFIGDLSVYDDYKDKMYANNILGKFVDQTQKNATAQNNFRNFFCYSFMRTMPLVTHFALYNEGTYNKVFSISDKENNFYSIQTTDTMYKSSGIKAEFMNSYNNLANLATMTKIVNDTENTYMFMANNTTHEPILLDATNNYVPAMEVDNTEYYTSRPNLFNVNGKAIKMTSGMHMQYYSVNMAALLRIGEWLEFLKANNLYDNTKIIIAADHGHNVWQIEDFYHGDAGETVESYFPLLLVKDFGASGEFKTDSTFMTNADVPYLATNHIDENNRKNPFTNKQINDAEKSAHPQYIALGHEWSIYLNNGNSFDKCKWASVKDNIWDKNNWEFSTYETVLTEHNFK